MGLAKKTQQNYVRIKDGKFYLGKDTENAYDELSGIITNLSFRDDEFEAGVKIRKLVVTIDDNGEVYNLSFPFDSSYASTFVSFLKNTDPSRELTIVPVSKTEGDKTKRSLLIKQDGNWAKSFYTKDSKHGQPDIKKVVKKSGKVEWDKEDFLEFREKVIMNELLPLINKAEKTKAPDFISADEEDEPSDDLPF